MFKEPTFKKLTEEIVREYTKEGREISKKMLEGTYKPPGLVIRNGRLIDSGYTPPELTQHPKLKP